MWLEFTEKIVPIDDKMLKNAFTFSIDKLNNIANVPEVL